MTNVAVFVYFAAWTTVASSLANKLRVCWERSAGSLNGKNCGTCCDVGHVRLVFNLCFINLYFSKGNIVYKKYNHAFSFKVNYVTTNYVVCSHN